MKRVLQSAGLVLCAACAIWVYDVAAPYARRRIDRLRYPGSTASSPLAAAMVAESAQRRLSRFGTEYRRVNAMIDASAARGAPQLKDKLDYARGLAEQGRFREAELRLNLVELQIPRSRENVRPADWKDEADLYPDVDGKPARRVR